MTRRALTDGRRKFFIALFLVTLTLNGLGLANTNDKFSTDNVLASSPAATCQSADGDQGGG